MGFLFPNVFLCALSHMDTWNKSTNLGNIPSSVSGISFYCAEYIFATLTFFKRGLLYGVETLVHVIHHYVFGCARWFDALAAHYIECIHSILYRPSSMSSLLCHEWTTRCMYVDRTSCQHYSNPTRRGVHPANPAWRARRLAQKCHRRAALSPWRGAYFNLVCRR